MIAKGIGRFESKNPKIQSQISIMCTSPFKNESDFILREAGYQILLKEKQSLRFSFKKGRIPDTNRKK